MQTNKWIKKNPVLLIALLAIVGLIIAQGVTLYRFPTIIYVQAPEILEDPLEAWSEASFIAWEYNSTHYACKNMSTMMVEYVGTNESAAIQWGIDNQTAIGGTVYVKAPHSAGTYNADIILKDKIRLVLANGAAGITVTIDSGATASLEDFHNFDFKRWDSGVLVGFVEDRSQAEQASYTIFKEGSFYFAKNGTNGGIPFAGTNASQVINNAIQNSNNGTVLLKNAEYEITTSSPIIINKTGVSLIGESKDYTILHAIGHTNIIEVFGGLYNIAIKNLKITMGVESSGTYYNGHGIYFKWSQINESSAHRSVIRDVHIHRIQAGYIGIYMVNGLANSIENVYIRTNGQGIKIQTNSSVTNYGNHRIDNLWIFLTSSNSIGVHIDSVGVAKWTVLNAFLRLNVICATQQANSIGILINEGMYNGFTHSNLEGLDFPIKINGTSKNSWHNIFSNVLVALVYDTALYFDTTYARYNIAEDFWNSPAAATAVLINDTGSYNEFRDIRDPYGTWNTTAVYRTSTTILKGRILDEWAQTGSGTSGTSPITIAHNLIFTPHLVVVTANEATPFTCSYTANVTHIKIYHDKGSSGQVSWYADVNLP